MIKKVNMVFWALVLAILLSYSVERYNLNTYDMSNIESTKVEENIDVRVVGVERVMEGEDGGTYNRVTFKGVGLVFKCDIPMNYTDIEDGDIYNIKVEREEISSGGSIIKGIEFKYSDYIEDSVYGELSELKEGYIKDKKDELSIEVSNILQSVITYYIILCIISYILDEFIIKKDKGNKGGEDKGNKGGEDKGNKGGEDK